MRNLVAAAAICAVLAAPASGFMWNLKVGGGAVLKPSPTRWGGHVSFELPLSDDHPTYIAPFLDFYRKAGVSHMPVGAAIIYRAPFSDYWGTVYFASGGGLQRVSGSGLASTEAIVTVAAGLSVGLTERTAVFVQGRWFRSFAEASAEANQYAFHAGLELRLGRE